MTATDDGEERTVEEQLEALRDDIAGLQDQIDGLSTTTADKNDGSRVAMPTTEPVTASPPAPVTAPRTGRAWRTMTAEQAAEAWRTLFDFVDWMTDRYDLHDLLPPCWFRHGTFVEELHGLHLAWVGAYLHPTARPTDPTAWHELQHRALTRLREADRRGCVAGTHRDSPPQTDDHGEAEAMRAAYADADVHRRARRGPDDVPA